MRILITGVTGFAGGFLAEYLARTTTAELAGLVRAAAVAEFARIRDHLSGIAGRLALYEADLTDAASVTRAVAAVQPDQVYHLAAATSAAAQDRERVFAINVEGTRHLLEACSRMGPSSGAAPVRVLLASTGYVYGPCDPARPAREKDELRPLTSVYGESKRMMEQLARTGPTGPLEVLIARPFNHTGPRQTPAFAVPAFAQQIAQIEAGQREPTLRVGNLTPQRDLLDVRDAVRAYALLMEHGPPGQVYNVCSGRAYPMRDLLDRLLALSDVAIEVEPDPDRQRPSDLPVLVGNPSKLKQATGWSPEIPLAQTLRETLDYWRGEVAL
jgi:GDP-4-dehydro-6-deoxy-D-mannose reductase